jgi:hypothetical protein
MQDTLNKAERYRKEANKYAELAKTASPAFLGEIYRKVAVRYVFMAEELQRGHEHCGDAIERADQMISRLRVDAEISSPHARERFPIQSEWIALQGLARPQKQS